MTDNDESVRQDAWKGHKYPKMSDGVHIPKQVATKTVSIINDILSFSSATSVLDIACGPGIIFGALFESDISVSNTAVLLATDLSDEMLNGIRERQKQPEPGLWSRVRIWPEDATKLSLEDNSQSHVISQLGIFLIPDHVAALHEAFRVTAPHGVFAMSSIAQAAWNDLLQEVIGRRYPDRRVMHAKDWWSDKALFKTEVEQVGFKDVALHELPVAMSYDSPEQMADLLWSTIPYLKPASLGLSEADVGQLKQETVEAMAGKYPDNKMPGLALLATGRK